MHHVEHDLHLIGRFTVPDPTDTQIRADVRRGVRALRRRRLQTSGVTAVTVFMGGALAVGVSDHHPASPRHPVAAPSATTTRDSAPPTSAGISLVAYRGPQLPGFEVARVPEGFVLQGVSGSVLAMARPDDTTPITTFTGKVVVTIEAGAEAGTQDGTPVTVNGSAGTLRRSDDGTATLSYPHAADLVQIQAWHDVPLTDQQLITLAQDITVTAHAQLSHG